MRITKALLLATLSMAPACSLFQSGSQQDEPQDEDDSEDDDADGESVDAAAKNNGNGNLTAGSLRHPQEATAWHTRVLVTTTEPPPSAKVSACIEELRAIALDASNQDAMIEAEGTLTKVVAKDPALYHFCFYQMAMLLDERLDGRASLFEDLAPAFFDGMRGLWIFARSLDRHSGGTRYFDYLKKRYVQISKEVFGRELQFVAPPLGAKKVAH